jgi:hypothetical protein
MSDEKPTNKKKIDWHDIWQSTIKVLAGAGALGLATLLWTYSQQGGLVRLLGGVTQDEFKKAMVEMSAHPQPMDSLAKGAIVSFDTACPVGWALANETIGSAIVGAGATMVGETGSPLPNGDDGFGHSRAGYDPTKETPPKPRGFITSTEAVEPISKFVFGVKTGSVPSYLPLFFCKKL